MVAVVADLAVAVAVEADSAVAVVVDSVVVAAVDSVAAAVVVDVVEVRTKPLADRHTLLIEYLGGGPQFGNRGGSFRGGNDRGRGRGSFRGGNRGGGGNFSDTSKHCRSCRFVDGQNSCLEREFMTDSIYVGQLPAEVKENDLKKIFPKAKSVKLISGDGTRPG